MINIFEVKKFNIEAEEMAERLRAPPTWQLKLFTYAWKIIKGNYDFSKKRVLSNMGSLSSESHKAHTVLFSFCKVDRNLKNCLH